MQVLLVQPQLGDIVYDRESGNEGQIIKINHKFKKAAIRTFTNNKIIVKISGLVILSKKTQKSNSEQFDLVKEFHEAFNHPVANVPNSVDVERGLNRSIWTGEEIVEFLHASSSNEEEFKTTFENFIKGLSKAFEKQLIQQYPKTEIERLVAQSDALTDASYFINGTFVEMGVQPQQLFEIVHAANMSKLFTDENGKKYAKYRGDGKIQKSPEFFAPESKLKEEVLRQIKK